MLAATRPFSGKVSGDCSEDTFAARNLSRILALVLKPNHGVLRKQLFPEKRQTFSISRTVGLCIYDNPNVESGLRDTPHGFHNCYGSFCVLNSQVVASSKYMYRNMLQSPSRRYFVGHHTGLRSAGIARSGQAGLVSTFNCWRLCVRLSAPK